MTKILFLDIDGPMIPGRAYNMPGQTKPIVQTFDPCAVGLLNNLCQNKGWRIVLHTSWIKVWGGKETYEHCVKQGIRPQYFHEDGWCDENIHWRYTRVAKWLADHPDVTKYKILDDEPFADDLKSDIPFPENMKDNLILVDFFDGIVASTLNQIGGRNSGKG